MDKAEMIMARMGFPESEKGPFVTELRRQIGVKVENGLRSMGPGTWAPGDFTHEQRAKSILAMFWEIDHARTCRVECLDGFIWRSYDMHTGKKTLEIRWRMFPAYCRDMLRRWRSSIIRAFGPKNPYREA